MIDAKALKDDLVKQVKILETDLRGQTDAVPEVHDRLRHEYDHAFKVGRTAATWAAWRDSRVTQAAAAWVLGTVFVRFSEDNGLLTQPFITAPDTERRIVAEEAQDEYFLKHPSHTDRDWLLASFAEIGRSEAGRLLFDERHNPLYQIPITHDAAKDLLAFWRRRGEDGVLIHSFVSQDWDTRFLGDLYQDLSEAARKQYALLQTPEFVEEFILDYTLTPAIEEFTLDGLLHGGDDALRMIDPTCGSGHFVLGAFHRILKALEDQAPARDRRELVRLALSSVHGVDVNPFAVAIARFRLFVAALNESGFKALSDVEQYDLPVNLAIGDSLIRQREDAITGIDQDEALADFHYAPEDVQDFPDILRQGRYHVVVGNPPYITVKDKKLNELYREMYDACSGKYALSVPFAQRFFELSRPAEADGKHAGYVGQITANSFMKREFGKKLIEQFFRDRVELSHVIDTSGAYIPGHGTPTVILIGRNKDSRQNRAATIRAVLGIRGEPGAPADPSSGLVWSAIVRQVLQPGTETEWISVADLDRSRLSVFPWSLSGGGAVELAAKLDSFRGMAEVLNVDIGMTALTLEDDVYLMPRPLVARRGLEGDSVYLVNGDEIRDFLIRDPAYVLMPYKWSGLQRKISDSAMRNIWPWRANLRNRLYFGKTPEARGLRWFDLGMFFNTRHRSTLSVTFAFVATHNHFVLDRGGKVFKQSAPVIKLPEGATEDDYLALLGVLNSSTACFWLKQVSHNKGSTVDSRGARQTTIPWEDFYEFTGTKLQEFPLPSALPINQARQLDLLAQELAATNSERIASDSHISQGVIFEARKRWHSIRRKMVAKQEELDWEVYWLYGLLDDDLTAPEGSVPELTLGERAFEIVLARKAAAGEAKTQWFARHGSTPITELPDHWPADYRAVVEKRIAMIESNRNIALIERPECKRRWATEGWDALQEKALRGWLLDRCERRELWFHELNGMEQPRLLTTVRLADELRRDPDFLQVAEIYAPGKDLEKVVAELVETEHVPYLAALRYKDPGLAKRADWENVWDLQRREDAAGSEQEKRKIRDSIPVPPKYGSGDFLRTSYWSNRGKLDVPKERFISYPYAGRDGASTTKDGALLLGWAGFDHREQAQALATLIVEREQSDGWGADKLTPLLAGLREVLPWVKQWHGEFDPNYGGTPAEVFEGFLSQYVGQLGLTDDDLTTWRPPARKRGRARKS